MSIIIKRIISEKANSQSELTGVYTFLVYTKAVNKIQIKQAVEAAYSVKVEDVKNNDLCS